MNGGFNPIKDIYKTEVFRLSALRNTWKPEGALGPSGEVIPPSIITRPPTAELRENQTDQDSLPPYDVLDAVLERLSHVKQITCLHLGGSKRLTDDGLLHLARMPQLVDLDLSE